MWARKVFSNSSKLEITTVDKAKNSTKNPELKRAYQNEDISIDTLKAL